MDPLFVCYLFVGGGGGREEGGRGGLSQVNGFAMSSRTLFVMVRFSIADVN